MFLPYCLHDTLYVAEAYNASPPRFPLCNLPLHLGHLPSMPLPLPFLGGSLALVLALYTLIRWLSIAPFTSPLRHVRIPPRGHGLAGHQTALMEYVPCTFSMPTKT